MGLNKVDNTYHGSIRTEERTELFKRQREKLIKDACRYGKVWQNMVPGPLRDFIQKKSVKKKAKYFCKYVFIFQRTSTSLITMYPVPEEILLAQKEYDEQKGK